MNKINTDHSLALILHSNTIEHKMKFAQTTYKTQVCVL